MKNYEWKIGHLLKNMQKYSEMQYIKQKQSTFV